MSNPARVVAIQGTAGEEFLQRLMQTLDFADRLRDYGKLVEAAQAYEEAYGNAVRAASLAVQGWAAQGRAEVAELDDRDSDALAWLSAAHTAFAVIDDREWLLHNRLTRARVLVNTRPAEATLAVADLVDNADRLPSDIAVEALTIHAYAQLIAGQDADAWQLVEAAIARIGDSGSREQLYAALRLRALVARRVRRTDESELSFHVLYPLARELEGELIEPARYANAFARRDVAVDGARGRARSQWGPAADTQFDQLPARFRAAVQAMDAGRLAEAEAGYATLLDECEEIRHEFLLTAVAYNRSVLAGQADATAASRDYAMLARETARGIGYARFEALASLQLGMLGVRYAGRLHSHDPLRLLAHARVLEPLSDGPVFVDGNLEWCEANVAEILGAREAAIELLHAAVRKAAAVGHVPNLSAQLARLVQLEHLRGNKADAREALDAVMSLPDDHPRVAWHQQLAQATVAVESVAPDDRTLAQLVSACDRYEQLRGEALALGNLAQFRRSHGPPYDAAVEAALELGRVDLAFELLQRGTSRALLDGIGQESEAAAPIDRARCQQSLRELGTRASVVEVFVGRRAVWALVVNPDGPCAACRLCETDDDDWRSLESALAFGVDAKVLENSVLAAVANALDGWVGRGGHVFIVPHGVLHGVPLHLVRRDGAIGPRPGSSYLPSASVLGHAPRDRAPVGGRAIVAGDPTSDLPGAADECRRVAQLVGATAVIGRDVTVQWLRDQLSAGTRVRLVHLACHGAFDDARPERSGLVLAADEPGLPWAPYDVFTLGDFADLGWRHAVVVLSACASGRHDVGEGDELVGITSALLAAGASTAVVSLWRVDDRITGALMEHFYAALTRADRWTTFEVTRALTEAQHAVRRQFPPISDHPWSWAPFQVVGTG